MYVAPTIAQFQTQFIRDFPYGTDPNVSILDADIINAFNLTDITINPNLWCDQSSYQIAYGYLAAHFLVLNLRASSQGLNGQYNFLQNSKSVNGVSEAFTIPQRVIDNPLFSQYFKTNYGSQYMHLVWPLIVGPSMSVWGRTKS
jgi:hypothetical protein